MKSDLIHISSELFSTRKFFSFLVFGFLWTFSLQANGFMSLDDELEIYGSKEIQINNYSYQGDFNQFVAVCSSEMARKLAEGKMDSSDFMQEIMNNMEIL